MRKRERMYTLCLCVQTSMEFIYQHTSKKPKLTKLQSVWLFGRFIISLKSPDSRVPGTEDQRRGFVQYL